jgi:hypothetical protein
MSEDEMQAELLPDFGEGRESTPEEIELRAISKELREIEIRLGKLSKRVKRFDIYTAQREAYDQLKGESRWCVKNSRDIFIMVMQKIINLDVREQLSQCDDRTDYAQKKKIARWLGETLRGLSAAILHPETNEECVLFASGNRDGFGRYVLEEIETKKRSGAYKSIDDLLPLRLSNLDLDA